MKEEEGDVPIDNVAKHFAVSVSTIRAWIRDNKIPKHTYMKMGTTYRFKLSAVETALVNGPVEDTQNIEVKQPIALY